jgi:adhesin/invasin
LDVIADPSNLAPGAYHGTITIAAPTATPASSSVDVSFTVAPGTDPVLSLDARNLSFAFARTGAPQAQKLTVSNSGAGKLTFTASASTVNGGAWLSVSPGSGLATPASPVTLGVTADPTGLPPGTYTGSVTINSVAVKVAMTVSSSNQAILLSQRGLTFTAVAGGGVIPPQTFSVLNIGAAPISWTVSTSTLAGGSNWLQASPGSGTTGLGTQSATPITVSVNPAGLSAGSYYGLVRIDAPGAANTPQVLTAFLQVLPAGSDVAPSVQPGALLFTAPAGGGSPGSATVLVYNIGATPKSFHTAASGGFVTLPTDATLNPQQPTPIVIQPFTTGLAPNVYSNTLTLQFSDGRVSRVNVKVIVTAAGSSSATSPRAPGCTPTKLLPALSTLADSFEVSAGWPVALGAVVRDDCGAPHSSGSVTVSFSNADPPVTLQSLADGRWEGTWPNRTTAGSKITLKIHAENPQLNIAGDQQVAGGLQSQQQPPIFDLAGITAVFNGPSYVPLAPGSVISIFGDRLAESATQSSGYPLPNQLVTTQIIMAGVKLPLYYVSQTQVNAVVPFALNPNAPQYLLVQRGLTYSLPALVNVAPAQPSLFPVITDYPATGGAPFPVTTANAAQSGDTLVLYCTGLGTVTPAVPDGAGPTGTSQTDNTVQLLIGGQSARVDYAGLAPGFAGLYQINAVVPSGVSSGNVPVAITVAGQTSPPVTIAVK